jgi:putative MATE family efflux protein
MAAPAAAAPALRLWPIAWPLFLELLLGIGVGAVGTVLAARLGDAQGAALALANHVFTAFFILFRVVGAGIGVVITQSLGAGRPDVADATAKAALGASTWIGAALAAAALLLAHPLVTLMQAPPEVAPQAALLLMALAPALLLDAWNAGMAVVMRAHLRARDTLVVMVAMHSLHLVLIGPLMFGWGGWSGLGLLGFAATVVAARLLALVLHRWFWRQRLGLRPAWRDWLSWRGSLLRPVAHIGLPGAAENLGYRLAFMVSVAAVGSLGTTALATHAYTQQVMMLVLLFGLATGLAAEVVVGHQIGAGLFHAADRMVRRALVRGLAVSTTIALSAALAGPWLMRLFTADPVIIESACTLLWLTVLLEPGRTFNLVVINALRATGDARYPVLAGAASMVIVLAGGSWLMVHGLGWGLTGVWIAYAADEWLRGLLMWRRWRRLKWVPHARAGRRSRRFVA